MRRLYSIFQRKRSIELRYPVSDLFNSLFITDCVYLTWGQRHFAKGSDKFPSSIFGLYEEDL